MSQNEPGFTNSTNIQPASKCPGEVQDINLVWSRREILQCTGEDTLFYNFKGQGNRKSDLKSEVNETDHGANPESKKLNCFNNHQTNFVKKEWATLQSNLPDRNNTSGFIASINDALVQLSVTRPQKPQNTTKYPTNMEDKLKKSIESTHDFDSTRPTLPNCSNSDTAFKNFLGPMFEMPSKYHLIKPPVIPEYLVKNELLADGVSPVVLGRGCFGRVIKAKLHNSLGHSGDIVVKEIFDSKDSTDSIFEEARLLLYLERSGYVPVCFGVVRDGILGTVFGVLQECIGVGQTLEAYLWKGRGKMKYIYLVDIARQLTDGLREIHGMGVIINDIKANNILMDNDKDTPRVKYCDMGLATYKIGRSYSYSDNADMFCHLAPEVRHGGTSCFKSDVYSIGYLLDMIQDFGEFDCLYPAIDKCLLENPSKRIHAEGLALTVSVIHNHELTSTKVEKTERKHQDQNTIDDKVDVLQAKPSIAQTNSEPFDNHVSSVSLPEKSRTSGPDPKKLNIQLVSHVKASSTTYDADYEDDDDDDDDFKDLCVHSKSLRPSAETQSNQFKNESTDTSVSQGSSESDQVSSLTHLNQAKACALGTLLARKYEELSTSDKAQRDSTFRILICTFMFMTLFKILSTSCF